MGEIGAVKSLPVQARSKRSRDVASDVFEHHPYGIVVVAGDGTLLGSNAAAHRLVGRRLTPGSRVGCELAGCRREGGPLAGICLHERALETDGALPEVRVDLPGKKAAVWLTVAALSRKPARIVMELRPGNLHDRRRRTDPHWTAGPSLRICALGRTRVLGAEGPIGGRWLVNRPGQILKYLVTERHRTVYADEIVERLWPRASPPGTRGLRSFVHALRDQLEPGRAARAPSSFVLSERGGYRINEARVSVDATQFEDHVRAGLTALKGGDESEADARLTAGLDLYAGDFLADEPYAEWALPERERLRRIASDAMRARAALKQRSGDRHGAAQHLQRLAELDPFDVDVHHALLVMLVRMGRLTEAARRYEVLRHRMFTIFGEQLQFTLADVKLVADAGADVGEGATALWNEAPVIAPRPQR
jgi:DNA-binding SARP family transcriptional activator